MKIRAAQMSAFQKTAEEDFVRRFSRHLLEQYAKTEVSLPDKKLAVNEIPTETLHSMIRNCVERARKYDLTFESSIASFSVIMFEVAPNFDVHELSQPILKDEETEPNLRLNQLLEKLTEENWEIIRGSYDIDAWQLKQEE